MTNRFIMRRTALKRNVFCRFTQNNHCAYFVKRTRICDRLPIRDHLHRRYSWSRLLAPQAPKGSVKSSTIMNWIGALQIQSLEFAPRRVASRLFSRPVLALILLLNCIHVPAHTDTYSQAEQFLIDVPVVELFTSQGCPNCPKADSALASLQADGRVLALSVHIDYWNYGGWVDRYSSPENSQRQVEYKEAMGLPYIFTPQFVINGKLTLENQARSGVEMALKMLSAEPNSIAAEIAAPEDGRAIRLTSEPSGSVFRLQFVLFDSPMMTVPTAGRNRGKTIVNAHPVMAWLPQQDWDGSTRTVPWPETDSYGVALLVTNPATREILLTVARLGAGT